MYRLIKIMTLLILMAGWMAPVWAAPGSLNTWVQTSTNIQPGSNGNAFSFSPNYAVDQTVFAATYTGVYKSTFPGGFVPFLAMGSPRFPFSPQRATFKPSPPPFLFGRPPWSSCSEPNLSP